jgi:transcriptional regulator with XRE-family HTH domain
MKTLGERLRHFRKNQDLTQEDLAKALSVHFQSVLRYEKSTMQPGAETVARLAAKFRLNPNWLLLGMLPMYLPGERGMAKAATDRVRESYLDYRMAPSPGAMVDMTEVPILKGLSALGDIPPAERHRSGATLLPRAWIPHPHETCIVPVEENNLRASLRKGDLLVMDWSQRGASFAEGGVVAIRVNRRLVLKRFVLTPMCYFFEDDDGDRPLKVNKEDGSPIVASALFGIRAH